MENKKTKVMFKKFKGEVIALLPDIKEGNKYIGSYMHIGQHSPASVNLKYLKNATEKEYKSLKEEMEGLGYELEILKPTREIYDY